MDFRIALRVFIGVCDYVNVWLWYVQVEGAENFTIEACNLTRLDGNALMVS